MEAVYYSDKSIAVFGDTKKWAGNLRTLGGSFNYSLTNGTNKVPGWVFSKAKEQELMEFISAANGGQIQPMASTYENKMTGNIVPMNTVIAPSMNPQEAFARLQTKIPNIQPVIKISKPLPSTATTLNFPNRFIGADDNQYEVLIYTVLMPKLNQKVTVDELDFIVTEIKKNDHILLYSENMKTDAYVVSGEWKILSMMDKTLKFL